VAAQAFSQTLFHAVQATAASNAPEPKDKACSRVGC